MSDLPTDLDARALVARLSDLDSDLEPREKQLLRAMLLAAMDPLERRRYLGTGLTAGQLDVLDRVEAARGGPGFDDLGGST